MSSGQKHHIIITGTGRAGTTFLMQLFTALGLDTGFTKLTTNVNRHAHAGMERVIEDEHAPYIVKQPQLCKRLGAVMRRGDIVIDHAIIPRRDIFQAAESRRVNARRNPTRRPSRVTGGTFGTDSLEIGEQEQALERLQRELMAVVYEFKIPYTEVWFPDEFEDPSILYDKLKLILSSVSKDAFCSAHREVWKPHLVHDYSPRQ